MISSLCTYVVFKFSVKTGKPFYVGTFDREILAKSAAVTAVSKQGVTIDIWQKNPHNENMITGYHSDFKSQENIRVAQIQKIIIQ